MHRLMNVKCAYFLSMYLYTNLLICHYSNLYAFLYTVCTFSAINIISTEQKLTFRIQFQPLLVVWTFLMTHSQFCYCACSVLTQSDSSPIDE